MADGKPVYPFEATEEKVKQLVAWAKNFPLYSVADSSERVLLNRIMNPNNVYVETDTALVMFQNVVLPISAHVGFIFWDRKVSGNERFLREVFTNMIRILKLRRLGSASPEKNRVMWRMLERVGFKREGCMREAMLLPDGAYTNVLLYGILYEELNHGESVNE